VPPGDPPVDKELTEFIERTQKIFEELSQYKRDRFIVILTMLALGVIAVGLVVAQVTFAALNMAYFSDQCWALNQLLNTSILDISNISNWSGQEVSEMHKVLRYMDNLLQSVTILNMGNVRVYADSCNVRGDVMDSLSAHNFQAVQ